MSDRIQELRANEVSPIIREHHAREVWDYEWETWCHILDAALALDALLTEALDGWEKAELALSRGATPPMSDFDVVRAMLRSVEGPYPEASASLEALDRIEAELARLREALQEIQRWTGIPDEVPDWRRRIYDEAERALTQENPDEG